MYKSECLNYDWFVNWLRFNTVKSQNPNEFLSANYLAKNFTRSFFEVSDNDVVNAMKTIGYDSVLKDGKEYYNVTLTERGHSEFSKHWE